MKRNLLSFVQNRGFDIVMMLIMVLVISNLFGCDNSSETARIESVIDGSVRTVEYFVKVENEDELSKVWDLCELSGDWTKPNCVNAREARRIVFSEHQDNVLARTFGKPLPYPDRDRE